MRISPRDVVVGDWTREVVPEHVARIADSFEQGGQVEPIVVGPDNHLISGRHRLEAALSLGLNEIEAVVLDVDGIDRELATIAAALIQQKHTVIEQGELFAREARLLELRGQRALIGRPRSQDDTEETITVYTTEELAKRHGLSKPSYLRRMRIATVDPDVIPFLKKSPIADEQNDLLRFTRLTYNEQLNVAEAFAADDGPKTLAEARRVIREAERMDRRSTAAVSAERTVQPGPGLASRRTDHTPFPSPDQQSFDVIRDDAREFVRSDGRQVHCVVTSPPRYGVKTPGDSQYEIGRETTPQKYIDSLCDVFGDIALHPLGSLWVNLRDKRDGRALDCIPERFVVAMEDRGWKLLDRVVWAKSALMIDGTTHGEAVTDTADWRLNGNGWEHVFRFSRTDHPWSDPCAIRIASQGRNGARYLPPERMILPTGLDGRIPPDVWLFGSDRSGAADLAPMPEIVGEIPIVLTCPLWVNPDGSLPQRLTERVESVPGEPEPFGWTAVADGAEPGIVFDPFAGSGSTGVVALRTGRSFIGCELYDQNCQTASKRLASTHRRLSGDELETESFVPIDQLADGDEVEIALAG